MVRRLIAGLLLTAVFGMGLTAPAWACPSCKEAVATQAPDEAARLKNGYFYSILLMVSMPFAIAGAGVFFVYRTVKRGGMPEL